MPDEAANIYASIVGCCEPAPPPASLPSLRMPDVWRLAQEPAQVLATLQRSYSAAAIRAAGVTRPNRETRTSELHPDFSSPSRLLIALCGADGRPYDLLLLRGSLRERGPAALAVNKDHHFLQSLKSTRTIFLTASLGDMAILRGLGFAALTIAGLDRLAGENVDRFLRLIYQEAAPPMFSRLASNVFLAGWSIDRLESAEPAGFDGVVGHFRRLSQHLGVDLDALQVWQPTANDVEAFAFVARHARGKDRIRRILAAAEKSSRWLIDRPEVTLSSALGDIRWAEQHRLDTDLRAAQHQIKLLYQRLVTDPLIDAAAVCSDLEARSLNLIAARLAEQVHLDQLQRLTHPTNKSLGLFHYYRDTKQLGATIQTVKLLLQIRKATMSCSSAQRMRTPIRMPDLFRQPP